nr:MAG TPA: hypothetical protein [Caudoviricetes sp.]
MNFNRYQPLPPYFISISTATFNRYQLLPTATT